jgi:excinuclease ABC subunit C
MLVGRRDFFWENLGETGDEELFNSVLSQFYHEDRLIPEEIVVPIPLEETMLLVEWLTQRRKGPVRLLCPQRGRGMGLIRLVQENAALALKEHLRKVQQGEMGSALLQEMLALKRRPQRIEAFDISNLMGEQAVGSMVVWVGGKEKREEYRHFRIKGVEGANDFAMLQEVLERYYGKLHEEGRVKPDLIVIDGGKGQLHAAQEVLERVGLEDAEVLGLAKAKGEKGERVFLPDRAEAILLPSDSPGTHLLQRIRDEAHRFAITYHRKLRKKASLVSSLNGIDGIGPVRKRSLLRHFGSLQRIGEATLEEIQEAPQMTAEVAKRVYEALHGPLIRR